MDTIVFILAATVVVMAAALAAAVYGVLKSKADAKEILAERDGLLADLAGQKQLVALSEDNARRRLADKDAECGRLLHLKEEACKAVLSEKEESCRRTIDEKNAEIGKFLQEKERSFAKTVETLKEQFANLAAEKLKAQSADLSNLNKTEIEAVLKPLREQVFQLQSATQKAESERTHLKESIKENVGAIETIAKNLSRTADALTSNTRMQGRAGEEILDEKLRQAGLEKNVTYFMQEGTRSDRPDAQVCDANGRWILIDSKVSLTSYMEYCESNDEEVKKEKLDAHVTSVRRKIDELAKRKYPEVFSKEHPDRNYLDITVMFVPFEAPLAVALKEKPQLWQFAMENNVVLVTPMTLVAFMRLVYLAWQREREIRNQSEIADVAQMLLSRMNNFLMTFEKIGDALAALGKTYAEAENIIVDGHKNHSIAKAAKKLIDLDVRMKSRKNERNGIARCLADDDRSRETE